MGNSEADLARLDLIEVHPHVHGELSIDIETIETVDGSSPRAWGTRRTHARRPELYRFIPTCMGNSPGVPGFGGVPAVHPHVHGELLIVRMFIRIPIGSSPRAWGTPEHKHSSVFNSRFIPTCMGNSLERCTVRIPCSVHPHVHGELLKIHVHYSPTGGSSPRAWGTRRYNLRGKVKGRFIPTCMGNSFKVSVNSIVLPVHPHVHGELYIYEIRLRVMTGSSPRAWGTH